MDISYFYIDFALKSKKVENSCCVCNERIDCKLFDEIFITINLRNLSIAIESSGPDAKLPDTSLSVIELHLKHFLINSREAIAAIIREIVVFYNTKNLNCIGALSVF